MTRSALAQVAPLVGLLADWRGFLLPGGKCLTPSTAVSEKRRRLGHHMSERIKVAPDTIMETLRAVVAERPDRVYEEPVLAPSPMTSCYYVHGTGADRTPGCLVGHVFNRLGVSLDALQKYEGDSAEDVAAHVLEITGHPDDVAEVRSVLDEAQSRQDMGDTWGRALEIATRNVGE